MSTASSLSRSLPAPVGKVRQKILDDIIDTINRRGTGISSEDLKQAQKKLAPWTLEKVKVKFIPSDGGFFADHCQYV